MKQAIFDKQKKQIIEYSYQSLTMLFTFIYMQLLTGFHLVFMKNN